MKIDDKIKKIKPYIIAIRYKDTYTMVDVKLKESWKVPTSKVIGVTGYENHPGVHMFYSNNDEIGVDDIVEFIEEIVEINIEREKKLELLSNKKNELTTFFNQHTFDELERMKFIIDTPEEVEMLPPISKTEEVVDEEEMIVVEEETNEEQ